MRPDIVLALLLALLSPLIVAQESRLTDTEHACTDAGGVWAARGLLRTYGCTLPSRDAGKPCKGKADCENGCDYDGPYPVPEGEVEGKCRATNNPFGCRTLVEGGKVVGRECVD